MDREKAMSRSSQHRWLIHFLLLLTLRGVVGAQRSTEAPRDTVPQGEA
jgi:hypothetical protein